MLNETADARPTHRGGTSLAAVSRSLPHAGDYSHILIPTSLASRDRSAVLLGLQLATAVGTKATVLHVVPIAEPASSWHWLDAIDGLQRKLAHPNGHGPALDEVRGLEHWRAKVVSYLERELPAPLLAAARIRVECRAGDPAEEILRFATHQSVDLVILSSGLSRWWLPVVPSRVHRVLRQLRNRVIVVRPEPVAHP